MRFFSVFRKKSSCDTAQKKAAVDRAYEKFMIEVRGFSDYWRDVFEPEYKAQPLRIENKVKP